MHGLRKKKCVCVLTQILYKSLFRVSDHHVSASLAYWPRFPLFHFIVIVILVFALIFSSFPTFKIQP